MPAGPPFDYCQEKQDLADAYVAGGWIEAGDAIPSMAGLAIYIGQARRTVYKWAKEYDAFAETHERLMGAQERELLNQGLRGNFNAPLAKMVLGKHGYSDAVTQDHKSSDGSMKPTAPVYNIVRE